MFDGIVEVDPYAVVAHLGDQFVDDLVVDELEQAMVAVDHVHLDPEPGEHRGIFKPDHASSDDGHG